MENDHEAFWKIFQETLDGAKSPIKISWEQIDHQCCGWYTGSIGPVKVCSVERHADRNGWYVVNKEVFDTETAKYLLRHHPEEVAL